MFGLDERIADLAGGGGVVIALIVALLLGLRHATDPDHLTAVSALVLGQEPRGARRAGILGVAWGLGHAVTLLAAGLPLVLLHRELPGAVGSAAEIAVGLIVVALAVRLLVRCRRGYFHVHAHAHGTLRHAHPHMHEHAHSVAHPGEHAHPHAEALGRSPLAAFGIGLVHGIGGSAAVGVLLLSAMPSPSQAAAALAVFATATAVSMAVVSAALGGLLARRAVGRGLERAVPTLGVLSLLFGAFYALAALP